jgi:FkbM family methyltransferase
MNSYSQAGQDEWVADLIGHGGYFVDVGAYDGVSTSNTLMLERDFDWLGICIEPNTGVYVSLLANRSCITTDVAASDHDGFVQFDGNVVGTGPPVACRTLAVILEKAGAPSCIDYLSVDVEGHEMEVLRGMDFDRWDVQLITIEHNLYRDGPALKNAIYDHLTSRGFVRAAEDVGCRNPCPPPAYVGCAFEDWYISDRT